MSTNPVTLFSETDVRYLLDLLQHVEGAPQHPSIKLGISVRVATEFGDEVVVLCQVDGKWWFIFGEAPA